MNGISQGQTAPEYGRRKIRARILMSVLGVSICGVAVGFFSYSGLGLDPFQCFAHGIWNRTPLSFGTWYMLLNAALLALVFFINRSKIGIGTLINLFLLGYIAEASEKLLLYLFPDKTTPLRAFFRTKQHHCGQSCSQWVSLSCALLRHCIIRQIWAFRPTTLSRSLWPSTPKRFRSGCSGSRWICAVC